jgi:hypothetical protein
VGAGKSGFRLLGDRPSTVEADPLGFARVAESLAALIVDSNDATPFTLGIEAGWGMGKTSLMRRIQAELESASPKHKSEPVVTAIEFNPWTTREGNTLEGLMKAVLNEVRGPLERLVNDETLKKTLRIATRVALALRSVSRSLGAVRCRGGAQSLACPAPAGPRRCERACSRAIPESDCPASASGNPPLNRWGDPVQDAGG